MTPPAPVAYAAAANSEASEPIEPVRDDGMVLLLRTISLGFASNAAQQWIATAMTQMTLPCLLAVLCVTPTCLGYWKSEYTVSYGYGVATALSATAMYMSGVVTGAAPWALLHCIVLGLYGARLTLFLLYRETCIATFREFREKIEARATSRGSRLARTPFIISCSLLYLGLVAPLVLSSAWTGLAGSALFLPFKICVGLMYAGFGVAALGDLQKSFEKARGQELVTGGIFAVLRHPNYTGEQVLWTANFVAACLAFYGTGVWSLSAGLWFLASLVGCIGINFVLCQATTNLETRQWEKYGLEPAYREWVATSWAGWGLPGK